MVGKYSGKAYETMERITEGKEYQVNKIYKHSNNSFYWYQNSQGWIHVIQPTKTKFNDNIYWQIQDSLLTKKDTLKEHNVSGLYNTIEEVYQVLENGISK